MTYDSDPPRLRISGSPDDPFVQALEEARLELPDQEQLAAVAARFSALDGGGASERAGFSLFRTRLRAKSVQAAGIALALAMGVSAAAMMRGRFPFTIAPKAERVSVAPPPEVRHDKPPHKREHAEVLVTPSAETPPEVPSATEPPRPRNVAPTSSTRHAPAHEADRPSQGDLPSSDVDGPPTPEAEAALLFRAHRALSGNPARALALTEEHRRTYASGALGQESDLIAIEALAALGRLGDARDRAAAFRTRYPSSAHLRRLDRLLGEPSGAVQPSP